MRLKRTAVFLTSALFAGGLALAQQQPTEVQKDTKTETSSKTTKAREMSVTGKVSEFQAGKSLEVTTAKNHKRKFDLNAKNTTVNGADNLKVGEMVKVTERTEGGQHTITVTPSSSARAHTRR